MATRKKNASSDSTLPKRVYGYVRVSTEEQAKEGISLNLQRAKIREYAKLHNLSLKKIFADEGLSASSLKRPELQKLLELTQDKPKEGVIVYRLNRLSRRVRDLLFLVEDHFVHGNTTLISINERIDTKTPTGRFFLIIMGALAQMERELIADRTKQTLQFKKSKGERLGTTPLGYKTVKGKLIENPKELRAVKRIFQLRNNGLSYQEAANTLNKEGVPTKRGGKWYASTVSYIFNNKRYAKLRKQLVR